MAHIDLTIYILEQTLDDGSFLAEVLAFPELSSFGTDQRMVCGDLVNQLHKLAEKESLLLVAQRAIKEPPQVMPLTVDLPTPRRSLFHHHDLRFQTHAVTYLIEGRTFGIRIPELGADGYAHEDDLQDAVEDLCLQALNRLGAGRNLTRLSELGRVKELKIITETMSVITRTPKQVAQSEDPGPSELERVADKMSTLRWQKFLVRDALKRQLLDLLKLEKPKSQLVVGEPGVGKTALTRELAHMRSAGAIQFYETGGARLVAGQTGYGMWQQRILRLVKELKEFKRVLYLGSLWELTGVGQSEGNKEGIAQFLQPFIASGEITAIAEINPDQLAELEKSHPRLIEAFQQFELSPPDRKTTMEILNKKAEIWLDQGQIGITSEALEMIWLLHQRFLSYSHPPGPMLRFLFGLITGRQDVGNIDTSHVYKAFSRETGLPLFLLDEKITLNLVRTKSFFKQRVLGQDAGVELITDLLATLKTRLSRPGRPLASLLFIGPTGVGKTEMAKSLAAFLFGNHERMTRFDMSEYANPIAVERLVGNAIKKDGNLTSKVREQPFCVLLFDEFEKADPSFFDLLLQILGDARLTDAAGRVAHFNNAVIILTSNLGAESFKEKRLGAAPEQDSAKRFLRHFEQEVQNFLRPEIYNRFDRIVPFLPLGAEIVERLCQMELTSLGKRAIFADHDISFVHAPEVVPHLARLGYEPAHGARPLKRAVSDHLARPIASLLSTEDPKLVEEVTVKLVGEGLDIQISRGRPQKSKYLVIKGSLGHRISELRRLGDRIDSCQLTRELANEVQRLKRLEARVKKRKNLQYNLQLMAELDRQPRLVELLDKIQQASSMARALEEDYFLQGPAKASWQSKYDQVKTDVEGNLPPLLAIDVDEPDRITLTLFGENDGALLELMHFYLAYCLRAGHQYTCYGYYAAPAGTRAKTVEEKDDARKWRDLLFANEKVPEAERIKSGIHPARQLDRLPLEDPYKLTERHREKLVGIGLTVKGKLAAIYLSTEAGVHQFGQPIPGKVLVSSVEIAAKDFIPEEGVERKGAIKGSLRREINPDGKILKDNVCFGTINIGFNWFEKGFNLINSHVMQRAQEMVNT